MICMSIFFFFSDSGIGSRAPLGEEALAVDIRWDVPACNGEHLECINRGLADRQPVCAQNKKICQGRLKP